MRVHAARGPRAYDPFPAHEVGAGTVEAGIVPLAHDVEAALAEGRTVVLDGVASVFWDDLVARLRAALTRPDAVAWVDVRTVMKDPEDVARMLSDVLPDDPVFGRRYAGELDDFFEPQRREDLERRLRAEPAMVLYGPGAALLAEGAALVTAPYLAYADVARNERQYRARAHATCTLGASEPLDAKEAYRRSYFVDWVVEERHFARLLPRLERFIDTQRLGSVTSLAGHDLRDALATLARQPFRVRPWFEPGVWGGQWIRRTVQGLNQDVPNYAWSFELITPENGLLLSGDGTLVEVPFHALQSQECDALLGEHAERFRGLFPIRFDWLDTVDGGNLSLQCHPRTDVIQRGFGEPFTQDETYYILDAEPEAEVYLGFQENVDLEAFRSVLEASASQGVEVDVRQFVQAHPARRGDLFLIPSGTVHAAGRGSLVLEISATPYIYTFKMYDWLRLDLAGQPRPLNIERAFDSLVADRQGSSVTETLIARPRTVERTDGGRVVHLPTHPEHFYDVHRLEVHGSMDVACGGSPHVLALVEGEDVTVRVGDRTWSFAFAETFVVPAAVGEYRIESPSGRSVQVIKAFLKAPNVA